MVKATMQEIDNAVETLVRSFSVMDDAPPPDDIDDIPESMADIAEETFETFSRGYIGESADAQGDMAEVIGEKIEKRLKELYPEKTDEKCVELTMIVMSALTHWIVLAEQPR